MDERTFVIIKPDGVSRGLIGEVIRRYEQKGMKITYLKMIEADRPTAEKHYEEHNGKGFYEGLISFITSGPIVVMVLEGEDAIEVVRRINGPTKIEDTQPGTIRGDFATSSAHNIVHGSDSVEAAEREIALWVK